MPAHFSLLPRLRLSVAFTLSLMLHGSLIISDAFRHAELQPSPAPAPALHAILRPPEAVMPAASVRDPALLLKNTFDTAPPDHQDDSEKRAETAAPQAIREKPKAEPQHPTALPATIKKPLFDEAQPVGRTVRKTGKPAKNRQTTNTPALVAVQRKLSEFVFYPEEARAQGIEGTVYLFIQLNPDCTVEDVRIDGSSGSRLLDKAAEKGAWAVHQLPTCRSGIYPYVFRLVD